MSEAVIAVHGGAGDPAAGTLADDSPYRAALEQALRAAAAALASGAGALDAAQAAVELLEDAPLFNAGRGSVTTRDGTIEMDAAVACGRSGRSGACAVVSDVRHPVALARAVMDRSPHLLLAGAGAERFAGECGLERAEPGWLLVERERFEKGTVGAVVRDGEGSLAAATSTGGMRGQLPGRIGDSPIVGAGTWADELCALSATGDGEHVIGMSAAHEVSALMRHASLDLSAACEHALGELGRRGAGAGLIAVDAAGNVALPFNTTVMHRGVLRGGGEPWTAVWR